MKNLLKKKTNDAMTYCVLHNIPFLYVHEHSRNTTSEQHCIDVVVTFRCPYDVVSDVVCRSGKGIMFSQNVYMLRYIFGLLPFVFTYSVNARILFRMVNSMSVKLLVLLINLSKSWKETWVMRKEENYWPMYHFEENYNLDKKRDCEN